MPRGRFTQVGPLLPLILAAAITVGIYFALVPLKDYWIAQTLTQRGWVPYVIVFLSFWCLMILLIKFHKIRIQGRALAHRVVTDEPEFELNQQEAGRILDRLYDVADDPRQFVLFNRIQVALSNLRNIGRVGDVGDVLRAQADNDESVMESSYTVARGLIWAIPVLGFIGTVLGLSTAIASFSAVLVESKDIDALKPALQSVVAGLATAFETTLQALIAAVVIHLVLTMTRRSEERLLDEFNDYCQRYIVAKLKLRDDQIGE